MKVLSPVPGVWKNPQALYVQKDESSDVYYSLNGTDPLESGLAYDGPILIEGTGKKTIIVTEARADGSFHSETITWTVTGNVQLPYVPFSRREGCVSLSENGGFPIPSDCTFVSGDLSDISDFEETASKGGIYFSVGRSSGRCTDPLVIRNENGFYRYLISYGSDSPDILHTKPAEADETIEFADWNYVRFYQGQIVLYKIDDGPWIQTMEPVFIDRTQDHVLSWKLLSPVLSYDDSAFVPEPGRELFVPAKPALSGMPEKGVSNRTVSLSLEAPDFLFAFEDDSGLVSYDSVYHLDVLPGDDKLLEKTLTVYYRGIRQGTIPVQVRLDKRCPETPKIFAGMGKTDVTGSSGFYRTKVSLDFSSSTNVYVGLSSPITVQNGYDERLMAQALRLLETEKTKIQYSEYTSNQLSYDNVQGAALVYVSAYSQDDAGNRSESVDYTFVIDRVNFYVKQNYVSPAATVHDKNDDVFWLCGTTVPGTKLCPFSSISEALIPVNAIYLLKPETKTRVFVSGVYNLSSDLVVFGNCDFWGENNARLIFAPDSSFVQKGGNLGLYHFSVESSASADSASLFQKQLISIKNGSFSASDCDFVSVGESRFSCFSVKDSVLDLKYCSVSVSAASYGVFVTSENSDLNLNKVKGVLQAKTGVCLSVSGGSCSLSGLNLSISGSFARGAEFSGVRWNLSDSFFSAKNVQTLSSVLWQDNKSFCSDKALLDSNVYSGFSSLF
ncbi:MAG: chitobiase/beta-hexosaminidase C-terminal domain-containing protein [Treponemataceae bacterium]|nr:chitobiase/beta-hexosaminidase C-terminal domain-containing protein [Treponemataceae bacterium]